MPYVHIMHIFMHEHLDDLLLKCAVKYTACNNVLDFTFHILFKKILFNILTILFAI